MKKIIAYPLMAESKPVPPETSMPDGFLEWNQFIGMPLHPATLRPGTFTRAQMEVASMIDPKKPTWIHLVKARQCGWTELFLRIVAYNGFHKYKNRKVGIIAGTRTDTTSQIFGRLVDLFDAIPDTIEDQSSMYLRLRTGTEYYGGPAAVETFTGWTKFGGIMADESAKWRFTDDRPVVNSLLPLARSNAADVFMLSTPNGPFGFFYDIAMQTSRTNFLRVSYDIWAGGSELYSKPQIQDMLDSSEEDPAQEYLCEFTIGRDSIWGMLKDEDHTNEYKEAIYA